MARDEGAGHQGADGLPPGMSVRDTSQLIGAAPGSSSVAEIVAMIAVVSNGIEKVGIVNSVTSSARSGAAPCR